MTRAERIVRSRLALLNRILRAAIKARDSHQKRAERAMAEIHRLLGIKRAD